MHVLNNNRKIIMEKEQEFRIEVDSIINIQTMGFRIQSMDA